MLNRILKGILIATLFILIGGIAAFKITDNIKKEAERQLKVQENIQIAANNQIIAEKEARENLQKERERRSAERLPGWVNRMQGF